MRVLIGLYVNKWYICNKILAMKNRVLVHGWRNRLENITPKNHRIGADILLIDDINAGSVGSVGYGYPFKFDVSMAIIYDQGEAIFNIDMRRYHIKAPAVIIIMKGQACEVICCSDDMRGRGIVMSSSFTERLFVGVDGGYTHELHSSMIKSPLINFEEDSNVFSLYYQLLLNIAQSPSSEFRIDAARHLTLSMFFGYSHMKHVIKTPVNSVSRQEEIYLSFLDVVERNFRKYRVLKFYADILCITTKYLSYVVREVSGRSAADIIEGFVITEIKALLLSTTMSIGQISEELNFPSQSVLGKYFKRVTGLSPNKYRSRL